MSVLSRYLPDATPTPVQPELTPMQQLAAACESLSVEAFQVGDIGRLLNRKGAKLSQVVREAFTGLVPRDPQRPESISIPPMQRMLNTFDYTELMPMTMNKPVALRGYFEPYAAFLATDPLVHILALVKDCLQPAQKRFSYYLSNPEEFSQRAGFEYGSLFSESALETLLKAQAAFLTEGNRTATAEFGDLFENKRGVLVVADTLNAANQQRWKVTPDEVNREVQKLVQLATTLLDSLAQQGDKASAEFTTMVAKEIHLVARWVEWYAAISVSFLDATSAMKANEKLIMALK